MCHPIVVDVFLPGTPGTCFVRTGRFVRGGHSRQACILGMKKGSLTLDEGFFSKCPIVPCFVAICLIKTEG